MIPILKSQLRLDNERSGKIFFPDSDYALAILPRETAEPFASRWAFNELIFCEIARCVGAPVHPAELFRAEDSTFGLLRQPFGERLVTHGFQAAAALEQQPFAGNDYNITHYSNAQVRELFIEVIPAMHRLFLVDQLLWMLDRTPANVLGHWAGDKYTQIRAIDHEHCLARGGDAHSSITQPNLTRCWPTQMTHFIDLSPGGKAEMVNSATALKTGLSVEAASNIAMTIASHVTEAVGDRTTGLDEHVDRSIDLFIRLRETLETRIEDFVESYAPLLQAQGRTP